MNFVTALGIVAGILTTIAFLPQLIKVWRTKSVEDISAGMFTLFSIGIFLWLIYGILINSLPVILANAVTLVLSLIILFFKVKYQPRSK